MVFPSLWKCLVLLGSEQAHLEDLGVQEKGCFKSVWVLYTSSRF